jgi:hypothetical protein
VSEYGSIACYGFGEDEERKRSPVEGTYIPTIQNSQAESQTAAEPGVRGVASYDMWE